MAFPEKSIVIVGSGIVGLCLGVAALARGYTTIVVARDATHDTASGVAAGMIAPALEAMSDSDPETFDRLKAAQAAWLRQMPVWPKAVQDALHRQQGAAQSRHIGADGVVSEIAGDWLVDAAATLAALRAEFSAQGGLFITAEVAKVTAQGVTLANGDEAYGAHVVVAAGYAAKAFAADILTLKGLTPIKGHLLDLPGQGRAGVVRSAKGYFADYGATAKFGASMEPGRDDLDIDPAVVADLKARALLFDIPLEATTPRTGIRASTPDNWPLIGLDAASGVWIATGMRRNGYVFAPFAAEVILDQIEGKARPDAAVYDPQRFA